jgi:hypothetical protein
MGDLDLRPRDALTWIGHLDGVYLEVAFTPRPTPPQTFDLALTLTPTTPRPNLFAVPQAIWLGDPKSLRQTFDVRFDEAIALRCEPRLVALFDHERRQAILALMTEHTCVIDAGRVLLFLPADHPHLTAVITDAVDLARHLATPDLAPGVARFLTDPNPDVRDHFTRLAGTDNDLTSLVAAVRADATLSSPDISHAALLAQVRDPALDLERRSAAFSAMLRRFPWSETHDALPRIKVFFGALSSVNRGAPFLAMLLDTLPDWLSPDVDTDAAFSLLEAAWSVRPPLTPELGRAFARIIQRLGRHETLDWVGDLLDTRDPTQHDEALLALDAIGASRAEIRKLIGPGLRGLLIDRAPHLARTHRRGAAFLELAASSLPPASSGHLQLFIEQLGELGDPDSVPFLLTHCEHAHDAVREAVLVAIGRCGTLDHVAYLEPQTTGLFRSSRIKQLARDAIAAIRERAGLKDNPGALSLADKTPGGLSLPDD